MSEIKWIKVMTDMFDNRKIKQIETLPEADSLIVIWLKLLCLAGSVNEQGLIYFTKEIPYTDEMMAKQFDRPINVIRLALKTFVQFEMIEIVDDIIMISNWEKYQNVESLDKVREQTRLRVQRHREKQKLLLEQKDCNVTETLRNETEKEKEKELEIEVDEERLSIKKNESITFVTDVLRIFIEMCPDFSKPRKVTATRIEAIRALEQDYTLDDFKEAFKNMQSSDFLRNGDRFDFDWAIKEDNFVKILENKYKTYKTTSSSGTKKNQFNNFSQRQDTDFDALEKKMTGGA